jgi:hypothetical protein
MKDRPRDVNTWEQPELFPSGSVTMTLRFGVVREGNHCQVQVESTDNMSGNLLSLWSIHHGDLPGASRLLQLAEQELRRLVEEHTGPF